MWLVPAATQHVRFRGWSESDIDHLMELYSDPITESFFGPVTRADAWRRIAVFIGHQQLRGFSIWALEDRNSGRFVGYTGLWFPEGRDTAELGYSLVASARGKGLATEAALAAREHGLRNLKLAQIVSYIQPHNSASIAVATRVGARRSSATYTIMDKLHDVYLHPNLTSNKE